MLDGTLAVDTVRANLIALTDRGETADDLAAAAGILRERMMPVVAPSGAADCCGTGGDGRDTLNVSTGVAFAAAACGVPMAKHGNRAATSRAGAADVLAALGVNLEASPAVLEAALADCGFAFLLAPRHHPVLARVAMVRKTIDRRTIFNLLGPLINPARVQYQLAGVYDEKWLDPMAAALRRLGSASAWIVHSRDGLDEISLSAPTDIAVLRRGEIERRTVAAADFGLPAAPPDALRGGDAAANAAALRAMLHGALSPYRDCVLANAAALLLLTERADTLRLGVAMAAQALDSGRALAVLERYKGLVAAA